MDERAAVTALVSDLHWQIDQLKTRGIKDRAGNPYIPSYYKRGLKNAVERGGLEVVEYVRGYLYRRPSDGYQKIEEADSLDLACEWLVADESKSYAHLFTDEDRAAAKKRLAPHIAAIEARKAGVRQRIESQQGSLPQDAEALRGMAADATDPEVVVAINTAILELEPDDAVALNRLGRGLEALGRDEDAIATFERAIEADPANSIARGRLEALQRKARAREA